MRFLMPHPPTAMRAMANTIRGVEAFAIPNRSATSPTSCRNHAAGFVMGNIVRQTVLHRE